MADAAASHDILAFLLAIAKENPVATSLVPMGFGFLLLTAEQVRQTVRPAATKLIYSYLGVCVSLVIAAFAYTIIQPAYEVDRHKAEIKRLGDQSANLQAKVEELSQEMAKAAIAVTGATVALNSRILERNAALEDAKREAERANNLQQRLSERESGDQMVLTRSLARIHTHTLHLIAWLHAPSILNSRVDPTMNMALQSMHSAALAICGISRDELVAMSGSEKTKTAYACVAAAATAQRLQQGPGTGGSPGQGGFPEVSGFSGSAGIRGMNPIPRLAP